MPTPKVVRRRRRLKAVMGLLAFALIGATAARLYRIHLERLAPPPAERLASVSNEETALLEQVNRERAKAGQQPLKLSARLAVIARGHSYDMAIRHYFSHNSPDGGGPADRIRGVGLAYEQIAENIYMEGFPEPSLMPERAVKGWLTSPPHRENMLSPAFRETGIGVARSSDGKTYVTQDFLR
jgi:uncharacterized protein YkwD